MSKVQESLENGILTVIFNNPPEGYFTGDMADELLDLLSAMNSDDIRVVVLTGAIDDVFVRHYSIEELLGLSNAMREKGLGFDASTKVDDHAMNRICRGLEGLDKPVIAALNGTTMGGGWELAMACDIRVAQAGEHQFGLPEVNLGILPGAGGTQRLARLVGTARALEMALRGRTVGAHQALSLGMVHEVAVDARERAQEIAEELTTKSAAALAHIKLLIRRALPPVSEETLQLESRLFMNLVVEDEANGLMTDFVAGRRTILG